MINGAISFESPLAIIRCDKKIFNSKFLLLHECKKFT